MLNLNFLSTGPSGGKFSLTPHNNIPPSDRDILAGVIYAESDPNNARDSNNVASVIYNRAKRMGVSPIDVISSGFTSVGKDSKAKFEPFLSGQVPKDKISQDSSNRAYLLADALLSGKFSSLLPYTSFKGNGRVNTYSTEPQGTFGPFDANLVRNRFAKPKQPEPISTYDQLESAPKSVSAPFGRETVNKPDISSLPFIKEAVETIPKRVQAYKEGGLTGLVKQLAADFNKNVSTKEGLLEIGVGSLGGLSSTELKITIQTIDEILKTHPGKSLLKYAIRSGGELPEVVGKVKSKFGRLGDDISSELGFQSELEAQGAVDSYKALLKEMREAQGRLQVLVQNEKAQSKLSQLRLKSQEESQEDLAYINDLLDQARGKVRPEGISLPSVEAKPLQLPRVETHRKLPGISLDSTIPSSELPSLNPIIAEKVRTVKQKVNIFDYLRTPEKVLNKIGLGKEASLLRNAEESYKKDLTNEFKYLSNLQSQVPGAEQRIFKYLDGESVTLSSKERTVAEELKTYLKGWADKLKLPEDSRIANYITHIFDHDLITKEFDPEFAKLITDRVPGSVYDPFLEQRLGALGYKENVWAALDAYVKRATRKFNFDPALEVLSKSSNRLDLESFNYVKKLGAQINMRPTEIDNLLDNAIKQSPIGYKFGQRPTTVLTQKFRQIIYRGTLGLNFGSALRNLTQGVNTYARLGEKNTVLGYVDLMRKGTQELLDNGVLFDNLIQDRSFSLTQKVLERTDKGLFAMFDTVEKINRGSAYYGGKRQAIEKGLSITEAINYAKQVVRDTQFQFGRIDTPVVLGSDISKTVTQLQSFNIKQTEFLSDMLKSKDFVGLTRWVGASLGVIYTVGRLLNMRPTDMIPTFRLGGAPIGNLTTGLLDQLSRNPGTRAMGRSKIKNVSYQLIPGGSQIKKLLRGGTLQEKLFGGGINKTTKSSTLDLNFLSQ